MQCCAWEDSLKAQLFVQMDICCWSYMLVLFSWYDLDEGHNWMCDLSFHHLNPFPRNYLLHVCVWECGLSSSYSNCHVCCILPSFHAMNVSCFLGSVTQNMLFLSKLVLVRMFYHRNRNKINAHVSMFYGAFSELVNNFIILNGSM